MSSSMSTLISSSSIYMVKRNIIPISTFSTTNLKILFTSKSPSISMVLRRNQNETEAAPILKEQPVVPSPGPETDPAVPPEIVTDPSSPFEPYPNPKPPLSPPGPDIPLPPRPPDVVPPHPPGPDIVPPPTTPPDITPPTGPTIIV